jgi:hypothetical protein
MPAVRRKAIVVPGCQEIFCSEVLLRLVLKRVFNSRFPGLTERKDRRNGAKTLWNGVDEDTALVYVPSAANDDCAVCHGL